MELKIQILFLLLILPLMIIPVYGHGIIDVLDTYHTLDVKTDQLSYTGNNTMIVSGNLTDYGSSMILLILTSPNNGIVDMKNIISDGHGHYTTSMKLGNDAMNQNGTYTIISKHNNEQTQTTIQYNDPIYLQNQSELNIQINKTIFSAGENIQVSGTTNSTSNINISRQNEDGDQISVSIISPINGTYYKNSPVGSSFAKEIHKITISQIGNKSVSVEFYITE